MITSWDDELVLVFVNVYMTDKVMINENIILDMERHEKAIPHRLDIVSKLLTRLVDDGYLLKNIAQLEASVTAKEYAI